jgi:hypothetical protein
MADEELGESVSLPLLNSIEPHDDSSHEDLVKNLREAKQWGI